MNLISKLTRFSGPLRLRKHEWMKPRVMSYTTQNQNSSQIIPLEYKDTSSNKMNVSLLEDIVMNMIVQRSEGIEVPSMDLNFTPVSGGITNKLFKCTITPSEDDMFARVNKGRISNKLDPPCIRWGGYD